MADRTIWSNRQPIVLETTSLTTVLDALINNHSAPSTLIICSTKDDFISALSDAVALDSLPSQRRGTSTNPIDIDMTDADDSTNEEARHQKVAEHPLLQPTLHMLTSTSDLKLTFCPSTPHTLAYLSLLSVKAADTTRATATPVPILAILNPIAQHEGTRSWSAQGLSKFFAAAASTAHDIGAKLVVAECRGGTRPVPLDEDDLWAQVDAENGLRQEEPSSWDEEVAITRVKAKGVAKRDLGWQGRMVKLRTVAEKWCRFVRLPED
ncbi:hypothetical protein C1H76_5832 [Elsinoe australis]|uniref:Uncharacterized protein n=1 Tax=Elsinoe australis TaxID=40998 RepID=A0A4U7AUZ2_9PEZI|nr:hypothetical protein C1H76_5832 [Elsinoe australis]